MVLLRMNTKINVRNKLLRGYCDTTKNYENIIAQ